MIVPLSVLDTQLPSDLAELLETIEEAGYRRYWTTEHHAPSQSASPTLTAALAAGLTERIRVGTAGILLRLTSAMRVAQDFAALELYFPGRIDLGIAGAHPGEAYKREYALDVLLPDAHGYADRVRRTVGLVRDGLGPATTRIPVGPRVPDELPGRPQLWLCGTTATSAALAAALGLRFAFHDYLADTDRDAKLAIVATYKEAFVAHDPGDTPHVAVAGFGCCAPTLAEAEAEWRGHFRRDDPPAPTFLGAPEACADRLAELATRYGADELAVDCLTSSSPARLAGLTLLARAFR